MTSIAQFPLPRAVFLLLLNLVLTTAPGAAQAARESGEKPNIIYIMVDDMGFYDIGAYGQEKIATPRLDAMAAEGLRFTDCYSGAPVCAPARSVLMTGQHTGHTPVRDNMAVAGEGLEGVSEGVAGGGWRVSILPEVVTMAEVLKQAGYTTGMSGKWGIAEPGTDGIPTKQGFDQFFGFLNQRKAHNHWPTELWHNEELLKFEGARRSPELFAHPKFTDFALDFIRENHKEPFFFYVAYTLPHWPLVMEDLGQYAEKDWPDDAKAFAAMVTLIDTDVGRILDLLKELEIDDNTIVFFTSDNGASSEFDGLFNSVGQMEGSKGSIREGGIRVPMIARWPGKVPAGEVDATPWYFADVLPTAADLAGAEPPENIDGVSILPTLLGQEQDLSDRFMYWEKPPLKAGPPFQAARKGPWKAYRNRFGADSISALYNLSEDHQEQNNVKGEHPELAQEFLEFFNTAHEPSPYWPHE